MRSWCVLPAVAAAALAGCTILHSSTDPADGGIVYHLPKTMIVAKVDLWLIPKATDPKHKYVITIDTSTRGDTVPDPNERFVLKYNSNPFFYDRFCVLLTESKLNESGGLLQSVEYATEDATPQIVLSLADLARKAGAAGFAKAKPVNADSDDPASSVTVTFNPFDPDDRAAAAKVVNSTFGNGIDVQFDFPELRRQFVGQHEFAKCRAEKGLCFRTKVNTPLRLYNALSHTYTETVMVDVVNLFHVGHFDLDRAFMVEKVVRLGFDNGVLTRVTMRKPSEVLQTVKLPLAVVDAILAMPANFIANTTGTAQATTKKLKDQQKEIAELQARLRDTVADDDRERIHRPRCKGRKGLFNENAT